MSRRWCGEFERVYVNNDWTCNGTKTFDTFSQLQIRRQKWFLDSYFSVAWFMVSKANSLFIISSASVHYAQFTSITRSTEIYSKASPIILYFALVLPKRTTKNSAKKVNWNAFKQILIKNWVNQHLMIAIYFTQCRTMEKKLAGCAH